MISAALAPELSVAAPFHISPHELVDFFLEHVIPHLPIPASTRVSELLADAIWSAEQEIEAQKFFTEERIKTLEQAPMELDRPTSTLDALPALSTARDKIRSLGSARNTLIALAKLMLNRNSTGICVLEREHCKLSWEYGFLHEAALIPFSADLIAKQATRINTGLQ